MCECNLIIGQHELREWNDVEHHAHNPLFRCLELALQVKQGECERASAGHLLASLEYGAIAIYQLPVSLSEIEHIAGRRLHDPII